MRRAGVRFSLEEVDIDRNESLRRRFTNDVPVVFIEGVEAFRHVVDSARFGSLINEAASHARSERGIRMSGLAEEECVPCRGGVPALKGGELQALMSELSSGWRVVEEHHLENSYVFPDFVSALAFTNRAGEVAEAQGHHPDILLSWGKVGVTIWTHKINGLTRSDFILAAKIDALAKG